MRIGIIGGGISGLASAWLLEEKHDVILFEKQDRLGGHANTIVVPTPAGDIPVEAGFEFFNSVMFPHFTQLLSILRVPTTSYSFNYTFSSEKTDAIFILPPWKNGKVIWDMLNINKLCTLLQLKYIVGKSKQLVREKNIHITIEQFLNQTRVTDSFKYDFFIPLFCAGWGISPEKFKTFAAYNLLSWVVENKAMGLQDCVWNEIPSGMSSYIAALAGQIKHAPLKTSTEIQSITYENGQYIVLEEHGIRHTFDHIIIATNAHEACGLLQNITHLENRYNLLNKIEYIEATIAIHGDECFMPKNKKDWSVANVWYNGKNSILTTHKPWHSSMPLFRSWLMDDFPDPKPLYAISKYHHAQVTPTYFQVQQELSVLQGEHNVWIAGLYTQDIDSHESALTSALKIAEQLAPGSTRYNAIMKKENYL
ncbi:MAG: FAD-dependent oxidoreductase [Candidatus Dependentiae bacterium]|nr:FAD-dependent oxidoreductase [Candidatus Dependentiae bacterium]